MVYSSLVYYFYVPSLFFAIHVLFLLLRSKEDDNLIHLIIYLPLQVEFFNLGGVKVLSEVNTTNASKDYNWEDLLVAIL